MRQDEESVVNKTITDRCLGEPDILYGGVGGESRRWTATKQMSKIYALRNGGSAGGR